MPSEPKHGRFIPSGRALASVLKPLLSTEGKRLMRQFRKGKPAVVSYQWQVSLVEAVHEQLVSYYQAGQRIAQRAAKRGEFRAELRSKAVSDWLPPYRVELGVSQTVEFAAQRLALDLAGGLSESLREQMRDTLGSGLAGGFTASEIAEAFEQYFGPQRANVIAVTEASRAQHAGEMDTYRALGIKKHSWLSSADACELCQGLDGMIVDIGQPFHVHDGGREAYRVVYHPPAHPVCKCSVIPVV